MEGGGHATRFFIQLPNRLEEEVWDDRTANLGHLVSYTEVSFRSVFHLQDTQYRSGAIERSSSVLLQLLGVV